MVPRSSINGSTSSSCGQTIPTKSGKIRGSMKVEIVGEEQQDRTPTNDLWLADHAGLVAALKLPGAKSDKSKKSRKSKK